MLLVLREPFVGLGAEPDLRHRIAPDSWRTPSAPIERWLERVMTPASPRSVGSFARNKTLHSGIPMGFLYIGRDFCRICRPGRGTLKIL